MNSQHHPKKTALYDEHIKLGARMIPFGDWSMPIFYEKVVSEHHHVRSKVGVFDVSHMGEIQVSGKGAKDFLQKLTINNLESISPGRGQYTAILNPRGGFIDDLIIYQMSEESYFLCVNASNIEKDYQWLKSNQVNECDVIIENQSDRWGQFAIQGPQSAQALKKFHEFENYSKLESMKYGDIVSLKEDKTDSNILVARTGYTGEKGFEVYIPQDKVVSWWNKFLEKDQAYEPKPIGLGARDTLRLEASYLLYGNEMDESVSPLEAGISWAVKLEKKEEFIGKKALLNQKEFGLERKLFAFHMIEGGVARCRMEIYQNTKLIGYVTSGSTLPTLNQVGGLALLNLKDLDINESIEILIRDKYKKAKIVKRPMYQAKTKT